MRVLVVVLSFLAATTATAQAPKPQTATYEAVADDAPDAVSRLRVTPVGADAYAIDFSVVAPNPSRHTGRIRGLAVREGSRLVLKVPAFMEDGNIDDPPLCTLVIEADEARARVAGEDGCVGFHGAGASFLALGRNLVRSDR